MTYNVEKNATNYQQHRLKLYFGCHSCPHRGTQKCVDIQQAKYDNVDVPVTMIKVGEKHHNGVCSGRINEIKMYFDMMKKPDGFRMLRNQNVMRLQEYTNHLYDRLMDIKKADGALSDDEKDMIMAFHKMTEELNKRIESSLRQDEGINVNSQKLTPSQLNELINDSVEKRKELENARDVGTVDIPLVKEGEDGEHVT